MILQNERDEDRLSLQRLLRDDPRFASAKIACFQYAAAAVFLFLVAGFWELQIRNPVLYQQRAELNRIKSFPLPAARGKILDRDGRIIVDNHSTYRAILLRESLKPEHLKPIAEGLNLDYDALVVRISRFKEPKYRPVVIKEELTPSERAFIESHRDPLTFPELDVIVAQRRLYPKDGVAAHVIGYVGEVSDSELNLQEFAGLHQGDLVGKEGIERQYNDVLMGIDGQRQVEVDNLGHERRVLESKPDVPGTTMQLTIDLDVEVVAELALHDRRGAVVALDPRTGEVIAMVSHPAYDPNLFATRVRSRDWNEIRDNRDQPMFNRAIQAQVAPGSTFKPIVALAGLETGAIDDGFRVTCTGGASFYGQYHACHEVDGVMNLHTAMVHSCDTFFYHVGNRLGIDRLAKFGELAGLGHRTGVDLPHEYEGIMPSTRWKARVLRQKWWGDETISVSIGQGALTTTPLQLASAIGGLATGGVWIPPHLVSGTSNHRPTRRGQFNQDNIQKVISGMYGVVNENGTGVAARLTGLEVCGKTGTAQVASTRLAKVNKDLKNNAWFVGFAPRQSPEVVVVALVEAGGSSSVAVPIVRDVLKAYFDKKARLSRQLTQVRRLVQFEQRGQLLRNPVQPETQD